MAPEILDQLVPSVLTCHCTVGVGEPLAAAEKLALVPSVTVVFDGCVVTTGTVFTVSVAALVVTFPAALVKIA